MKRYCIGAVKQLFGTERQEHMKIIVVYSSKTGFTKKYAGWIAEDLNCACKPFREVSGAELSQYDCIIYGGWLMASHVSDLVKLRKMKGLEDKKMVIFAVGATPMESEDVIEQIEGMNLASVESSRIPFFYFEGGINYEKMGFLNKKLLGGLRKSLEKKEKLSRDEEMMLKRLEKSYDGADRAYIAPLIERVSRL